MDYNHKTLPTRYTPFNDLLSRKIMSDTAILLTSKCIIHLEQTDIDGGKAINVDVTIILIFRILIE